MTEEEPTPEPGEENPQKTEYRGTHNEKRVEAFVKKNQDKYDITDEHKEEIVDFFESGDLTRFDQITTMARSRADQRKIPLMDAIRSVVEDNREAHRFRDQNLQEETPDDQLAGLDEEKARLGYRGERGLPGDRIDLPRDPRTHSRQRNFDQAQVPPEEKPGRKENRK